MTQPQLRDLVKASNPVVTYQLMPDERDVRTLYVEAMRRAGNPPTSVDLLEQPVERRRDMQTQDRNTQQVGGTPTRQDPPRWRPIAALLGAAAIVIAVMLVVSLIGGDNADPVPDVGNTTVPTTTVSEPEAISPLEIAEALNQATRDGDWEAARLLYADDATYIDIFQGNESTAKTMAELATGDNFNNTFDWDGDGTYSIFDREAGYLMNEYVAGVENRFSCTQTNATTVVCDIVSEGYPFLDGGPVAHSNTYTVVDGRIAHLTYEVTIFDGFESARGLKIEYQDWVRANRSELNVDDALFEFLGTPLVVPETIETHRQLIAEWKEQR